MTNAAPSETTPVAAHYERHIFFCLNERPNGEDCCSLHGAKAGFDHCKRAVQAAGLAGKGQVRVNKAGCLDRCAAAPVCVVYPEGVWYSFIDESTSTRLLNPTSKMAASWNACASLSTWAAKPCK